jgi:glycosyltransferase involved in cell wall biosynthesis
MMISVIICTYNPDPQIFSRLINAVASLKNPKAAEVEVIIIDNNSRELVAEKEEVKELVNSRNNVSVYVEKKPGLTNARLAGTERSKGEWLVFFDDDNEPEETYLQSLETLIDKHPEVGCWGPGVVRVEYIGDEIHPWFYDNKQLFQEKHVPEVQFGSKPFWLDCYPFGTGLSIRREIVETYRHNVVSGKYTLTDRIGKKLVSGGDTQLVFHGIKLRYHAGTSPSLALNHLIADKKVKFKYMLRQVYMTTTCFVRAYNEIGFDDHSISIDYTRNAKILQIAYSIFKINAGRMPFRNVLLLFYERMGEINARYFADNIEKRPFVLRFVERCINV